MITNEQIKNLCSRLRLYALPRLLESEAHLAQEQGKKPCRVPACPALPRGSGKRQQGLPTAAESGGLAGKTRPRPFRPQLLARYNRTKIA